MAKTYEKIYLSGGATQKDLQYGPIYNVSLDLDDAEEKGAIREVKTKDGKTKRYLNFTLSERKEPTEWGQTHTAFLNVASEEKAKPASTSKAKKKNEDELPF